MIIPVVLAGRCANGNERGGGRVVHAMEVADDHKYDSGFQGKAICGATYGARSAGFSECDKGTEISCTKCLRKLVV